RHWLGAAGKVGNHLFGLQATRSIDAVDGVKGVLCVRWRHLTVWHHRNPASAPLLARLDDLLRLRRAPRPKPVTLCIASIDQPNVLQSVVPSMVLKGMHGMLDSTHEQNQPSLGLRLSEGRP